MQIQYAVRSAIGSRRGNNEDCYRVDMGSDRMLFAVADGMGGHPCGEVASMIACEALAGFLDKLSENPRMGLQTVLKEIFFDIDEQIKRNMRKNPGCLHMGTTLSVMVLGGDQAVVAHVGDTRIYCLRDEKLQLLTTDHTFVQEMVEKGALTAEMGATVPHRNVLTHVVGTDEPLEVVFSRTLDIIPGDRFLLSSDGLHDSVSFHDIEQMMQTEADCEETAERLLASAIAHGGHDDITCIIVHTT
ncbi:PP2C family serine/threonine-protein phosphatase [Desulforhopalus sp. IMCC35007]|uniref:PP2C family protein-serine/threonine phosphatase n=1 Tax=Desulforhopalus sp. IMCC35007 TaxID=2569543 RepID=UPI0010AE1112|nr:protein phosphatase 2C domain-containing protein [Desulforhopalus sp. IMCC35007]TKB11323.1 serine/threonine-protein phosphatase [Desulforhopalus sp. IMCC35007]